MPFTPKTIEFLLENQMNNSREWFREHKAQYEAEVKKPMYELAQAVGEGLLELDPEIITEPKRMVSRINRDLRFSKNKTLYRDHLWFNVMRKHERFAPTPCLYFDIAPRGFSYGCGFYSADPKTMAAIREMALAGHPAFLQAKQAASEQALFTLRGEQYKRLPHPGHPEGEWLNRKNLYLSHESTDSALLFSGALADTLVEHLRQLGPVYSFFRLAMDRAAQ